MKSWEIVETLVNESLNTAWDFKREVYYENGKLGFSSPMTENSWTEDPAKVGTIDAMNINEFEGLKTTTNDNVTEVSKDSLYYYDDIAKEHRMKRKPKGHEQFYDESVYMNTCDVIEWIINEAEESNWYEDIIEEIDRRNQ